MRQKNTLNQKGQTLVFILLIMTVALAIGVAISSRTISTIRRTTNIDTSSRALAAAEAAIEYYLAKPTILLDQASGFTGPNDRPTECSLATPPVPKVYPDSGNSIGNDINTSAEIVIKRIGCVSGSQTHSFDVDEGKVFELRLDKTQNNRANLRFDLGSTRAALYIIELYDSTGLDAVAMRKTGYLFNSFSSSELNGFTNASGGSYLDYQTNTRPYLLRIIPIGSKIRMTYSRTGGSFNIPYQAHEITATGKIGGSQNSVTRTVVATKTLPHLPAAFNFALFSKTGIN